MIKYWTARNFKAISDATVDLGNLNVVLGKNSVGKSSLIQSVIAASQYFGSQYPSAKFSFIGNAQDLGPASLVQNRRSIGGSMELAFKFSEASSILDGEIAMRAEVPEQGADEMQISELLFRGSKLNPLRGGDVTCNLLGHVKGHHSRFYWYSNPKSRVNVNLGFSLFSDESYREQMMPSRQSPLEGTYHSPAWLEMHLLVLARQVGFHSIQNRTAASRLRPESGISIEISLLGDFLRAVERCKSAKYPAPAAFTSVPENLKNPVNKLQISDALQTLLAHKEEVLQFEAQQRKTELSSRKKSFDPRRTLPRFLSMPENPNLIWTALVYLLAMDDDKRKNVHPEFNYLFELKQISSESTLDRYFAMLMNHTAIKLSRKVKYLGPMRAVHPSEQRNGRSPSPIVPIGRGGEYLAHFLHTNHSVRDLYCLPNGAKKTTLSDALDAWLSFFDIGKTSSTSSSSWGASEYLLDGERTNQKGTGVSQILPVILIALLSSPGDLLIIEQPELHLHPAQQRKLADLLVAFSEHGVQVIAETHSEYLVTRLRLLIATGKIKNDEAKIIFAETKGVGKKRQVHFKASAIDSIGKLDYWPDGFFEESLSDRLLLSSIQFAAEDES